MSKPDQYDAWFADAGPAALVIREHLVPITGPDGVLFPASFAAEEGAEKDPRKFQGGYNIDADPDRKTSVCLVDSVGSQANRIEPLFALDQYKELVPQITITVKTKDELDQPTVKEVRLLDAGHRAGDALVRATKLQAELAPAFRAVQMGNAEPLARVAPTSVVFGVWDSRNTQAKLPRLVSATIRAYDVQRLTRSAQYGPPVDYAAAEVFSEDEQKKAEGDKKNPLAVRGFVHVPATATHGGVVAAGGVRRDATLSLAALRLLAVREAGGALSTDKTAALRRYILGLSLVALTAPMPSYLRQGCDLVPDTAKPREFTLVHADGRREPFDLTHADALAFARRAAEAFGVAPGRTFAFEPTLAKQDLADGGKAKKGNKKKGDKSTAVAEQA